MICNFSLITIASKRRPVGTYQFNVIIIRFVLVSFAETVHAADVRGKEQPSVRRQLPAGHDRRRWSGRVRYGPSDGPTPRGDRGPYARGAETSARRGQHEHYEQGTPYYFSRNVFLASNPCDCDPSPRQL